MSNTANLQKITVTIDGETNPLRVTALFSFETEPDGLVWAVEKIVHVELVVCDSIGLDITDIILRDKQAAKAISSQAADQEEQIFEAITSKTAA